MPISDAYIIQYLLDGTSEVPAQIHWREKDPEQAGYVARLEGVDVILEPVYSRAGSRLTLRFRQAGEEFTISEPAGGGWLGRKFSSEDERHLGRLFRGLIQPWFLNAPSGVSGPNRIRRRFASGSATGCSSENLRKPPAEPYRRPR